MYSSNSKVKFTVIIAAAGSGKRMNLETKKQFLEYNNRPLYITSVEVCEKCDLVDEIIIVTSPDDVALVQEHLKKFNIKKVKEVVPGGKERQDSIYNGLLKCSGGIVAVQDGARPFLQESYLSEGYQILMQNRKIDGLVVAVPVKDTIKVVSPTGEIFSTPNRNALYQAQTPQIFRYETLLQGYKSAYEEGYLGSDDSSLVERLGKEVKIMLGSYSNIKITTQEDLEFINL